MSTGSMLGRALGVFSVALGAAQVAGPRRLLRATGFRTEDPAPGIVRGIGVRELLVGGALLSQRRLAPFAWLRVAGDAMDIALMASVALRRGLRRDRATASLGIVGAISVADLAAGVLLARGAGRDKAKAGGAAEADAADAQNAGLQPVRAAISIDRPRDEVYAYWRRLEQLPTFMRHLESVTETGDGRSHWTAKGPAGSRVSWDATITEDRPGERIAWEAVPDAQVRNAGAVTFTDAPGSRGTEVHVELTYEPPAGPIGVVAAKLFGEEPGQQVPDDLRRLKQVLETGEVVVAVRDGQDALRPASTASMEAA